MELATMFKGRGFDIKAAHAQMKQRMDAEGLPFAPSARIYNSRLAQELGAWGEAQGKPAIHMALYRAYFVDGVDIGQIDALVKLAEGVGLPGDEARRVLDERALRDAVDEDWQTARELGITGVPTYVAGRSGVVGAQPYEVLVKLAETAGATKRAP